ncbi:ACP S-malonyltransferase [Candidatus Babela massiliensis]|uniref:[acyl-carrier-protein] S-malonyltransferase n=1 Tax=Candidatus Babela massiliensis TaxID=673862 RepID=V6DFR5_9BACT|nr:acyltransferase domain-containing protein [Candidatus Babela massiliensis]CDK30432.1 (acyl-carrier-protein) S-malonyltransferase [Candidatus Babela massiliensis]
MKVGMLFPGYGNQFVGMAKELYDNFRIMQEYFEEASHCLDSNFVKLCYASSDIELGKISNAYPSIFLLSTSIAIMLKDHFGIKVDKVAGHGLGEYSALCFSGGISFPDGLYLLKKLSDFYTKIKQQIDVKTVVIDGLSSRDVKKICKENSSQDNSAQISVYSKDSEHMVTGNTSAVEAVAKSASSKGADKVTKFNLEEALHNPLLREIFDQLKLYLTKVDFKDLLIPMISCINGKEVISAQSAQNLIMDLIIKPICWNNVLKQFSDMDIIIIPSPSKNFVSEIRNFYPNKAIIGIESLLDIDNLKAILEETINIDINDINNDNDSIINNLLGINNI